jgi:hypothetical protein
MGFRASLVSIVLFVLADSLGYSQEFNFLEGKWVSVAGPTIGEPIWFYKAFGGYDALISWWGQTTISQSNGEYGSHIQVRARDLRCFYYIGVINSQEMTWALRSGSPNCPQSAWFKREP